MLIASRHSVAPSRPAIGARGGKRVRRASRVRDHGGRHSVARRLHALSAILLAVVFMATGAPGAAWAESKADLASENALADDDAGFGLVDFTRYQTGNSRLVEGEDLGYRYPMPDNADAVIAVTAGGEAIAFVDEGACAAAGFDAADAVDADAFRTLAEELDGRVAKGGETLADNPGRGWTVSTSSEAVFGPYRVRMGVEAGGRRYISVVPAELYADESPSSVAAVQGLDLSDALLWVDVARLVSSGEVVAADQPAPLDAASGFFQSLDLRPFWVSLKTSAVALIITFVLGLLAAWRTMGTSSRLKGLLDSVFTIPMVLPPTVCGFLLLLVFGNATPVGRWLIDHGASLVFTWEAAVIAAVVVSFPLMYRTALGAFESLDAAMLDAARTLGWGEGRIFVRLMMPLAWPSIAAGTVLAFARAMGEFGCTLFFAGNYAGVTQTIPIAIYFEWMSGNTDVALFWVVVVIAFSFLVVLFINLHTARSLRYRERGGSVRAARRGRAAGDGARAVGAAGIDAEAGGDALRIDTDALRALVSETSTVARVSGARAGAPSDGGVDDARPSDRGAHGAGRVA